MVLRQDLLDRAVLTAIGEALDPAVPAGVMEKAAMPSTTAPKPAHESSQRRSGCN